MPTIHSCLWGGLLPFVSWSTYGQDLSGKVLDAQTGQPVPYASVSLVGTTQGTSSNAEGEFKLRGAKLPGRLLVSELSHRTDTLTVTGTQFVLARLQPSTIALPEVQLGSYTTEVLKKAYRQLQRTQEQKSYSQALYRQVTTLDQEPTEVQEMVWQAKSGNAGVEGTAMTHGRYAKKKALLNFKDFSLYTRGIAMAAFTADSAAGVMPLSLNPGANNTLRLVGVTENGERQLVEIGFRNKAQPENEYGSVLIDAATYQVLRYRTTTQALNVKVNNPAFKLTGQTSTLEWVFHPIVAGAPILDYVKVEYRGILHRPIKADVPVQASSFLFLYDSQREVPSSVTYLAAKKGLTDLEAIKATSYHAAFWQNNSAVKRTPLEEKIIASFEQQGAFGTMLTP